MKSWKFEYEGSTVEVQNGWGGEKLFVNNQLQDEQIGMASRSRLYGELVGASGERKQIKVSLGGGFSITCIVFINNKEVFRS